MPSNLGLVSYYKVQISDCMRPSWEACFAGQPANRMARLDIALVQRASDNEDDIVNHVAIRAVVQKLAQVIVRPAQQRVFGA